VGPSRTLAISATVLLVASGLGGFEAATLLILGPALTAGPVTELLLKPFVILAYLEACAIFFSVLGIVLSIICLIFYSPYLLIRDKIRSLRRPRQEEELAWDGPVYVAPGHYREEDGAPD
jgi:hypothetical protein